jgi:hypothetical protein
MGTFADLQRGSGCASVLGWFYVGWFYERANLVTLG